MVGTPDHAAIRAAETLVATPPEPIGPEAPWDTASSTSSVCRTAASNSASSVSRGSDEKRRICEKQE